MLPQSQLPLSAASRLPDLKVLATQLDLGFDQLLEHTLTVGRPRMGRAGAPPREALNVDTDRRVKAAAEGVGLELLAAGRRAVHKLSQGTPESELSQGEQIGLEAIVLLTGRPALLIQEGRFFPPPQAWRVLEDHRAQIEATFPRVGRIEVDGHPELDWVGTGFLVADGVLMTNRHVAKVFCRRDAPGRWSFEPGMAARVDFVQEFGSD